jgi:hypothetical protein
MVAVDDARRVRAAREERLDRLALASDVVAVFPDEQVVALDLEVAARLEAGFGEVQERKQRGLRRVGGADGDDAAREIGHPSHRPVRAHDDDRRAARSASIHASGEFHATWHWPAR